MHLQLVRYIPSVIDMKYEDMKDLHRGILLLRGVRGAADIAGNAPDPLSGFAFKSRSVRFATQRGLSFLMLSSDTRVMGRFVDVVRYGLNGPPERGR